MISVGGDSGVAAPLGLYGRNSRVLRLSPSGVLRLRSSPFERRCSKGHILLCLEGQLDTELDDSRRFTLTAGMSYQVGDNAEAHRSSTAQGAKLFIVD